MVVRALILLVCWAAFMVALPSLQSRAGSWAGWGFLAGVSCAVVLPWLWRHSGATTTKGRPPTRR